LHDGAHTPAEHDVDPLAFVQAVPQVPQLLMLVLVLVSQPLFGLPSQFPKPTLQPGEQTPPAHDVVPLALVQAVPQVPQLLVLVRVSVSQPLFGLPSQSAQPAAHVGVQAPAVQLVEP